VKIVATTQTTRSREDDQPSCSASPPQTPAIIELFTDRVSFMFQGGSDSPQFQSAEDHLRQQLDEAIKPQAASPGFRAASLGESEHA
jgi:hypothetical protein